MPDRHAAIVEWLRRPDTYPERPKTVELIETHISHVFLTDELVYKLKKPVRYEFVDFSTLQARRQACEDEVRLNRRLAPHVYLGVVPIVWSDREGPRWQDATALPPVEYVVKMRRLPQAQMLDAMIAQHRLTPDHVARLAARLAEFYSAARPLTAHPWDYLRDFEHHIRANRQELLDPVYELPLALVKRVHAAQLVFLHLAEDVLAARVCDGRLVDGHGDLRPEHVCLTTPPVVFDCVEFSAELRRVDVADELCFLAMECQRLEADDIGRQVLAAYCRASGDQPPPELLDFYKSYRACVRAKVAALRWRQLDAAVRSPHCHEAAAYLELADGYRPVAELPSVVVIGGLMGTGKSTLASALAQRLGFELLQTDAVRRELLGASPQPAAYGQGLYRPELRDAVYGELAVRADRALAEGLSVVLDGTYLTPAQRQQVRQVAAKHDAGALFFHCECPADVAMQRMARRQQEGRSLSEARPELLEAQLAQRSVAPGELIHSIDTTLALEAQQREIMAHLRSPQQPAPL